MPPPTEAQSQEIFDALDRGNADAWVAQLAPDVVMRFANQDPVYGRVAARATIASLLERVTSLAHEIVARWQHGDATIVEALVHVVLPDGRTPTVPMVTIYRRDQRGLVADYRIYADPQPIWP